MEMLAIVRRLIEDSKEGEEEAFGAMPENLQGSEKGQKMESAVEGLEEALSNIDDVVETLQTVIE
jgi:hypothetical protein